RDVYGLPEHGMLHLVPQVGEDRGRGGEHVLLPAGEMDDLPDPEDQADRQQLRPDGGPDAAGAPRMPARGGQLQVVQAGEGGGFGVAGAGTGAAATEPDHDAPSPPAAGRSSGPRAPRPAGSRSGAARGSAPRTRR